MRRNISALAVLLVCGLFLAAVSTNSVSASVPGIISSVAYDSSSNQVDGYGSSINSTGQYIEFQSDSSSLTPGYTNEGNIFVRDTVNNTTTLVSASSSDSSEPANTGTDRASEISYDGRYVVFASTSTNLVSGVTAGHDEIYERDLQSGTTSLVSAAADGTAANSNSEYPSVTADGRFVVFGSAGSNLVSGVSGIQIYMKDMKTGSITLISKNSSGTAGNSNSYNSSISCDGGVVAFSSASSNLVSGDTDGQYDEFVDVITGGNNDLTDVTLGSNAGSDPPAVSCDGNYIAFGSTASNFGAGSTGDNSQVYEYNRLENSLSMVSVDSSGDAGNNNSDTSSQVGISGDGRYVVFGTSASNLGGSLSYPQTDIRDTIGATTQTVSVNSSFDTANNWTGYPAISENGAYVSLESTASNLVSGITTTPAVYKAETGF